MKAEIMADGYVHVIAETVTEAYALRSILPKMDGDSCGECGRQDQPVVWDCTILDKAGG